MKVNFHGIKCDNPKCDFVDMTVEYKDYKRKWLNKPCPKCGDNLLTKADMKTCKKIVRFAKFVNFSTHDKEDKVTIPIKMDGSGKIEF